MHASRIRRLSLAVLPPLAAALFAAMGGMIIVKASAGDDDAGASDGPRIGDHWHAAYEVSVCGIIQPLFAEAANAAGIHTHGDGIIHLHPTSAAGEGAGASVASWIRYEGGELTGTTLRLPQHSQLLDTARDSCPDGRRPSLRVLRADSGIHPLSGGQPGASFAEATAACTSLTEREFQVVSPQYIPRDGDCIRIAFDAD